MNNSVEIQSYIQSKLTELTNIQTNTQINEINILNNQLLLLKTNFIEKENEIINLNTKIIDISIENTKLIENFNKINNNNNNLNELLINKTKNNTNNELTEETVRMFVQEIYVKFNELLENEESNNNNNENINENNELIELNYNKNDLLKRLRIVLKQITNEKLTVK